MRLGEIRRNLPLHCTTAFGIEWTEKSNIALQSKAALSAAPALVFCFDGSVGAGGRGGDQMTNFMRKRAAGSRRTTMALLAAVIGPAAGAALWGAAMAAQAGDPAPQRPAADTQNAAPDAAKPLNADDRVICKREESLGTHLDKRVCHTKREWRQIEADEDDESFRGRDPSITARGSQGLQPH
jgi:hypothetical protein